MQAEFKEEVNHNEDEADGNSEANVFESQTNTSEDPSLCESLYDEIARRKLKTNPAVLVNDNNLIFFLGGDPETNGLGDVKDEATKIVGFNVPLKIVQSIPELTEHDFPTPSSLSFEGGQAGVQSSMIAPPQPIIGDTGFEAPEKMHCVAADEANGNPQANVFELQTDMLENPSYCETLYDDIARRKLKKTSPEVDTVLVNDNDNDLILYLGGGPETDRLGDVKDEATEIVGSNAPLKDVESIPKLTEPDLPTSPSLPFTGGQAGVQPPAIAPPQPIIADTGVSSFPYTSKVPISTISGFEALAKLHCVAADYNQSNQCHPKTRRVIIENIVKWAGDPGQSSPKILWLHGNAGEGKSSISASVACRLEAEGLLGASFFFSRDTHYRNRPDRVFSSIAFNLSFYHHPIGKAISDAVEKNPDVGYLPVAEQFHILLKLPLKCRPDLDLTKPIVIVIDALDECEDRQNLLAILTSAQWPSPFKILLSSKPKRDIKAALDQMDSLVQQCNISKDVPQSTIENDIRVFISERFSQIRSGRDGLNHWPTPKMVETLVDQSHGLFIWASTAMKFIEDDGINDPKMRLDQLLKDVCGSATQNSPSSALDRLYCIILKCAFAAWASRRLPLFKRVVGAILAVAYPLPPPILGTLLYRRVSIDAVRDAVSKLHSVIDIHGWNLGSSQPIRITHRSFADFVTDERRSQSFSIDLLASHTELVNRCLAILASREMVSPEAFAYASLNLGYHLCYVLQAQKRRKDSLVRRCLSELKNSLKAFSQNLSSASSTLTVGLFDPWEARHYWKPVTSALEPLHNYARDLTPLIQNIRDQIAFCWAHQIYPPTDPPTSCRILKNDTVILILGAAGCGKSSFINLATESLKNSGSGSRSGSVSGAHRYSAIFRDPENGGRTRCTKDNITAYRCRRPHNTLRNVVLVDTPGFDSRRPDKEILEIIGQWLAAIQREKHSQIGFLFLHRVADTRVSTAPLRIMTMIERLYCKHLQNVTIATTRWDEVDDETGSAHERDWSHRAIARGARLARFEHTFDSAWEIINGF